MLFEDYTKKMKILLILPSLVTFFACDQVKDVVLKPDKNGNIVVSTSVEVPLLPIDLPVFPTALTMDGMGDNIEGWLQSKGVPSVFIVDSLLNNAEVQLAAHLEKATASILQPGSLSSSVQEIVVSMDRVEIEEAGLEIELSNDTAELVSVPAAFEFYLGEQDLVNEFSKETRIPFEREDVDENSYPVIRPGEKNIKLKVESIPYLVENLNQFLQGKSVQWGMGYRNIYRMVDTTRGAEPQKAVSVFGKCSVALAGIPQIIYPTDKEKDCPQAAALTKWRLTVHSFKLLLKVNAKIFEIPKVLSCEEYAKKEGLINLEKACSEVTKS